MKQMEGFEVSTFFSMQIGFMLARKIVTPEKMHEAIKKLYEDMPTVDHYYAILLDMEAASACLEGPLLQVADRAEQRIAKIENENKN